MRSENPFPPPHDAPRRPVHTYSIVARDPATGELGVAVQSHWFSVGTIVTWAEAGVGAIATQAFASPAYGPRGLSLMHSGVPAPEALSALLSTDAARDVRQVAFVDAQGRAAALVVRATSTGQPWADRLVDLLRVEDHPTPVSELRLYKPGIIPDTPEGRALVERILREAR